MYIRMLQEHEPVKFQHKGVDNALRCGILFVRHFRTNFDDDTLWEAMQFCVNADEREYFMMAVIGELRELAGGEA